MNNNAILESKKHYHHRDTCRLCLSEKIKLAIPFSPTPIAEKYTKEPTQATPLFPVDLYMCEQCGHVQILDVIDPEYLWSDYTYHSGQTQGIVKHFEEVSAHVIDHFGPFHKQFALDVGSNDGTLLRNFKNRGFRVLGIDPATQIAAKATENGIETIADLMSFEKGCEIKAHYGTADLITAFNVFAHADEMKDLLKGIVEVLDKDGLFVFEVSYLKDIIDKMLVGTIFHEHLCNHSLIPLIQFLNAEGLEVIHVEHVSIQGGSIIGYAQHIGGPRLVNVSVENMVANENNAKLHDFLSMENFVTRLEAMKSEVKTLLDPHLNNKIAGYGAARSGPMLITQFGLGQSINEIYDDHPQKVGLYTPGDSILVKPTQCLYETNPAVVVILAWIHAKAIVRKHTDYILNGGSFLTLSPEVKLIDKSNYEDFIK
ncbi:methyltransferase domain-containing protein [Pseudoalteromonas xiamenensis]|uniref:Methyltransferase domain-containing protein n=2 Tax=Pseudoalteromonas xiamenensis TaxID=882626 RepID=A0A975DJA9_9GAMM|nr:methyltransferase domain-containing protein [Pseudoalteromonas xiamenensis]